MSENFEYYYEYDASQANDTGAEKLQMEAYEFIGGPVCSLLDRIQNNQNMSEHQRESLMTEVRQTVNADVTSVVELETGGFLMRNAGNGSTTVFMPNGDFVRLGADGSPEKYSPGISVTHSGDGNITKVQHRDSDTRLYLNRANPQNSVLVDGKIRIPLGLTVQNRNTMREDSNINRPQ